MLVKVGSSQYSLECSSSYGRLLILSINSIPIFSDFLNYKDAMEYFLDTELKIKLIMTYFSILEKLLILGVLFFKNIPEHPNIYSTILVAVQSFSLRNYFRISSFLNYLCVLNFLSVRLNYRRGKTNRLYGNSLFYTPSFSIFAVHKKGVQNEFCCAAQLLHAPFSSSSSTSFLWLGQYLIRYSCASSGCVRLVIELPRLINT